MVGTRRCPGGEPMSVHRSGTRGGTGGGTRGGTGGEPMGGHRSGTRGDTWDGTGGDIVSGSSSDSVGVLGAVLGAVL